MKNEQVKLNLMVIGANGGIGRQTVELALYYGHHVTAVLRDPAKLQLVHNNLKVVKADVMKPETFESHLEGIDAVKSAIGVKGGFLDDKPTRLYSEGNANLLEAMKRMNVNRAFFISASAVEISPVLPFFVRLAAKYVVQKLLKHMYADLLRMEELEKRSGLDWTIIRPPRLTDKPTTGNYRFAINSFLKNALVISRADVAHFMINNVNNETTYRSTIEIAY